jgi:ABC-2 type transport system permease protein
MALLITERAVRDRRRGVVGWAVGLALYVAIMSSVYPSIQNSDMQRALRSYPDQLKAFFGGAQSFDFSTGAGYLNVELFSLVVPALLVVVAIAYGAATLAGEQEKGTLDLLLANPVSRRRVVLEKVLGLVATVLVLAAVIAGSVILTAVFVDLGVGSANVVIALLGAALLAILTGLLAMLVGAATGSRAFAVGVPAVVFVASYLISGLSGLVSALHPLRLVSPFYLANGTTPLQHGLPVANYGVLLAVCVLLLGVTVAVFDQRNLAR